MTVDPNEKVSSGSGEMGGTFTLVPEGDIEKGSGILMEFTGKVEITENKKGEESLMVEAGYVDDPTARCAVFCKLSEQTGLTKLLDIITLSGVDVKIKRKKPDFDSANLTGKLLTNPKFHDQLKNDIQGCRILATVKHSPGTDKEGNKRTYANINRIASTNNVAAKPASSAGTGETQENSGW